MQIVLRTKEKGQEFTILHDLNFQNERYEARHPVVGIIPPYLYGSDSVNFRILRVSSKGFQKS